jgi:hypothetical protein
MGVLTGKKAKWSADCHKKLALVSALQQY